MFLSYEKVTLTYELAESTLTESTVKPGLATVILDDLTFLEVSRKNIKSNNVFDLERYLLV